MTTPHSLMGPTLVLILGLGLLRTTTSFPTNDSKDSEGPTSTPEPDCELQALLFDVFGTPPTSNCSNITDSDSTSEPKYPTVPLSEQKVNPNPKPDNGNCTCVLFKFCRGAEGAEGGTGVIDKADECDSHLKCCEGQNVLVQTPARTDPLVPTPPGTRRSCGLRNLEGIGLVNGAKRKESYGAWYGEFPWMAAVLRPEKQDNGTVTVYQCGGSLIHPQVVLTGAHWVSGKDNLVVRAGEWDNEITSKLYPAQDIAVKRVIVHEGFNNGSLANDPALLILEAPVDMSVENVGLVCLPEPSENMDGRTCVASGWGKHQSGEEGKLQVIMKKVDLPIVPREPCQEALRNTKLGPHFKLHETFLCAGGIPGQDTCKGDGGSPLVCPRGSSGEYVQAGIVAWGIGCNTATPGVYVNVPYFVDWISDRLREHGLSIGGEGDRTRP